MRDWWPDVDWLSRNLGKLLVMFGVIVLIGAVILLNLGG